MTAKSKKRTRPGRKPREKVEPERWPPILASEAHLTCRQFRPGTRETCKGQAIGFLPMFGDTCLDCARGRLMIRYATARVVSASKAA